MRDLLVDYDYDDVISLDDLLDDLFDDCGADGWCECGYPPEVNPDGLRVCPFDFGDEFGLCVVDVFGCDFEECPYSEVNR